MHHISVWWSSMIVFSQIFWSIAIFGTMLLIMQVISMFLGFEHFSNDTDASVDVHQGMDHDTESHQGFMAGLKLFTLRNMVAFICMFGWTGIVMIEYDASKIATCFVSLLVGCFSMVMMGIFMRFVYSMQASGNIDESQFIGKGAIVYIPIPEKGKGIGKINFTIGTRLEERQAMSNGSAIPVGTTVKTISYSNNIFTVERV